MKPEPSPSTSLLKNAASAVGKLAPALKAVVAGALPLATAIVNWASTGQFNAASIETAALGFVSALVVYLVPNKGKAPVVKT